MATAAAVRLVGDELPAAPGWYATHNSIRWWDGSTWTVLSYPKKLGINWGGGTYRSSLGLGFAALVFLPLFAFLTFWPLTAGEGALAAIAGFAGSMFLLLACLSFINAHYVKELERRVDAYVESTHRERPPT